MKEEGDGDDLASSQPAHRGFSASAWCRPQ